MSLEILKPPFIYGGNYKWDWDTYHIRANIDGDETPIIKVMPIADHGYYRKLMGNEGWENFIKELAEFTVQALKEKWERDFGESLRWTKRMSFGYSIIECPKCEYSKSLNAIVIREFNYCPHCGQRLLPPEDSNNG
jgi:hypothetical protein